MKNIKTKIAAFVLTLIIIVSGMGIPGGVQAATGVAFSKKAINFSLGEAQTFVIGDGDAVIVGGGTRYRKVYKISMPAQGILNISLDSVKNNYSWGAYIYSASDLDNLLLLVEGKTEYKNSSGSYQQSMNTTLDAGEYYICIGYNPLLGGPGRWAYNTLTTDPTTISMSYIKPTIKVSNITLNTTQLRLDRGSKYTLTATVSPSNATNKDIIWKSEDNSVATVAGGVVTAVNPGTTRITASSADGGASVACTITVPNPTIAVSSVTLNASALSMTKGKSVKLVATVNPANASNKTIIWTSSAPEIASVQNGVVKAKMAGTAVITAISADGIHSAKCTVVVQNPDMTSAISTIKNSKPSISVLKSGKKKITVKFNKIGMSGVKYQISYRKGNGSWKNVTTTASTKTITKLTSKKTYSVRVRAYKIINGKIYYGNWSKVKKIKVK